MVSDWWWTRFDNAVKQICCQKNSFACAYTCVRVCTWVYICICARVCAAGRMRVRGFARIWAWAHMREYCRNPEISSEYLNIPKEYFNIGGIFKYRLDIKIFEAWNGRENPNQASFIWKSNKGIVNRWLQASLLASSTSAQSLRESSQWGESTQDGSFYGLLLCCMD